MHGRGALQISCTLQGKVHAGVLAVASLNITECQSFVSTLVHRLLSVAFRAGTEEGRQQGVQSDGVGCWHVTSMRN